MATGERLSIDGTSKKYGPARAGRESGLGERDEADVSFALPMEAGTLGGGPAEACGSLCCSDHQGERG